jgi:2-dehydro-3-deoxyphosphogalactonate aldolase
VLPTDVPLLIVGGVKPNAVGIWFDAGANGFGLGSALYKPGYSADQVAGHARDFVKEVGKARNG